MRVRHAAMALAAATALVLTGCTGGGANPSPTGETSATPVAGGSATIVISGRTWSHFDVAAPATTPIKDLMSALYDSLVRMDDKGNIIPWLATSWDESADGLTWTFHLRSGVQFQDGTPFNAAAVKFNIERQLDPNQHAGEAGNLPKGTTVTAPDDATAVFHFTAPDESILSALASTAVGFMASPTAIQKYGTQYGLNPVGTGPFMLKSQVVGQTATLVKNPNYWVKGEPYLDSITYNVLGSADSALQTIKSGGADIMDYVQPQQAHDAASATNLQLIQPAPLSTNLIFFNTAKAPFNDIRARQAVTYAIDQATLAKSLFFGFSKPTESMISSGSWAYPGPTVDGYSNFDLSKAKDLVSQLGGSLSFEVETGSNPDSIQLMTAVQTMLAAAGIKMDIKGVDPGQKIADLFSHNFVAAQFTMPVLPDPNSLITQFFSGANPTGLQDAQLSQLLVQGNAAKGQDARKAVYLQVVQRMAQLAPMAFLGDLSAMRLQTQDIHGVAYTGSDFYYLDSAWVSK